MAPSRLLVAAAALSAVVGALPTQGNTPLYPPYNYQPGITPYIPDTQGIPSIGYNSSKQPWNTQPGLARPKPRVAQSCSALSPTNPSSPDYWYEKIDHNGESPFINNGASYTVYRNVVADYGADNTGANDASAAIQKAIDDGSSSGQGRDQGALGTTGQPAVIYLPPGTYKLASSLQLYVNTVLIGNPIDMPVIQASSGFTDGSMIYGKDPNQDSTTAFYIAIKNVKLDSTNVNKDQTLVLLDWSVSQATQLTNVVFNMPDYSTGHTGLGTPEGGSGTMLGDLTFNGGAVGIHIDNQQYEFKTITFNGCTTGIKVKHCFDCVFVGMTFENTEYGIDMTGGSVGSVVLLDSTASNLAAVVNTDAETTGDHTLVIENLSLGSGVKSVVTASGNSVLNSAVTDTWVYGNAYTTGGGSHQTGTTYTLSRPSSLVSNGNYITIPPPTYAEYDVSQIINVKSVSGYPVAGDGSTDDTASLNSIISMYAGCAVLFFPQGTYIVTDTLVFPVGSRVVGEAWSAISATGSNFYNPSAPTAMVQVGNPGDVGVAQFSDILFTVADVLQGCTLLEVNMAGQNPGDVGFWNTHFRVGGAMGSKVETNCGGSPASCKAAFLLAHLTSSSSAYIEDMWGWTADHDLDGGNGQTISTGRGLLVEATAATWLHGTAFEHNTLYQYNLHAASNVFIGMQQSETPYWQGPGSSALAPAPWAVSSSYADPDFSNCGSSDAACRMAWFMTIAGSSSLNIYGSGFWTFFNNGDGGCQNSGDCQTNGIAVSDTTGLRYFGINTHSVVNVLVNNGQTLVTQNNNPGSWGACVGAMLADQ